MVDTGLDYPLPIQWNPFSGHPSMVDIHYVTDTSESPDCPSIHLSNPATLYNGRFNLHSQLYTNDT